ncbi:MAG: hypothetical protein H0U89_00405, partial [Acidimicrobiia bacterium]|nr:hypothetical protein [Acidimicrobiia bacterium]
WGALALVRSGRVVALVGMVGNAVALGGWVVAKTSGIPFIEGLDVAEAVQTTDGLAAGLALASVVGAAISLRGSAWAVPPLPVSALAVTVLAFPGLLAAGSHAHAGADDHGDEVATADDGHADGHAEDDTAAVAEASNAASSHGGSHAEAVPYDPELPIDLSGVEGVTAKQQAAAENIVADTLRGLPQWADPAVAEAAGFRTIGDGGTGIEHLVNPAFMANPTILDPDEPESLVYDTSDGGRRLVAAMYMVEKGTPLEAVPDIGGNLMQWHTHTNLCFNAEGRVAGITNADGNCPAELAKPVPTPMIHVWIESHPCGPFAALEGIGGGDIPTGEERLCDSAHGA